MSSEAPAAALAPLSATDAAPWPLRAWGLALLGGAVALAIYFIVRPDSGVDETGAAAVRLALATFLGVGALSFGFVMERGAWRSSLIFALIAGVIVATATYWNGPYGSRAYEPYGSRAYEEPWRILCAALTVGIAAPLFQALRDRKPGQRLRYSDAHNRAWVNAVLWCAVWVFVGIAWLMTLLLSELFQLIGIRLLKDLIAEDWAALILTGTALGAATGVLRDREAILATLQRVVTTVLSILAPVLAAGLVVFLAALPFTGLTPLWEATKSTTPILLVCVIGALGLVNAVIGDRLDHEARHPALRASMLALSIAILPLGVIAGISTGSRIDQYGLTPDRLWAAIFTGIACAYGLAYLGAVVRGRMAPAPFIRAVNLKLAFGLCALALLLATPLINFGTLSTRNQVARLTSGATTPDQFDWQALRFDFGPAGIAALRSLASGGSTPAIRQAASRALEQKTRWPHEVMRHSALHTGKVTVLPVATPLPPALQEKLDRYDACASHPRCFVIHEAGSDEAIIVNDFDVNVWRRHDGAWRNVADLAPDAREAADKRRQAGLEAGQVEVRTITRRQVYVGGEPLGQPFE